MRTVSGVIVAAMLLAACGQVPATEVILTVDATADVASKTDSLEVQIAGAATMAGPFTGTVAQAFGPPMSAVHFPRVFALVPRQRDATRRFQVLAIARHGEEVLTTALVRSGYVEHRLLHLTLLLDETACERRCATGETCRSGRCEPIDIDPMVLADAGTDLGGPPDAGMPDGGPPVDGAPPGDATSDAGPQDAGFDADIDAGCTMTSCDDHIACTRDLCDSTGNCMFVADSALCTAIPGGTCDPTQDCQYPTCTPSTCVNDDDACMIAMCAATGTTCNRTSRCTGSLVCCHGDCAAPGCDDGDPCTDDTCSAGGCRHSNNTAPCNDGNPCTINDACAGDACVGVVNPCDDGNFCTDDMCDVMAGCVHASNFMECMSDPTSCVTSYCNSLNHCQTEFCSPPSTCCAGTCMDIPAHEVPPAC